MIIAVDDSGDPGLNSGKGASTYFVIAAVCFENDLDAEKMVLKIKQYRRDLGWKEDREFKFRKTNSDIRLGFFDAIRKMNFKVAITLLNKNDVDRKEFYKDASKLYNATILKTVSLFGGAVRNTYIRIDGEGGRGYRHKTKTYFRQNLPKNAIKELVYRDSEKDNLIQLADMIAGAARYSVSGREDAGVYLKKINKHIADIAREI